jgi:hypothetical protein
VIAGPAEPGRPPNCDISTSAAGPMLQRCDRHRRPIEPVPTPVSRALAEIFAAEHGRIRTDDDLGVAYLDRLRARREWLTCGCREDGEHPMLFPCRRSVSGTVFLRREVGVEHDPACPWHRLVEDATERRKLDGELQPVQAHLGTPFLLLRPALGNVTDADAVRRGRSGGERIPTLARVLFGLLQRAGLDRVAADQVHTRRGWAPGAANPKSQYARLRWLDNKPVAEGSTLCYRHLLCTWLPSLSEHLDRLRRLGSRFPRKIRPQGLFWGVVDEVDSDGRTTRVRASYGPPDARHTVETRLPVATAVPGRCRTGPFWLVAALGQPGDNPAEDFEVLDTYAHPAYSRSLLLPVDSDAERNTAALLLDQLAYWRRSFGTPVTLHKPFGTFDLDDGDIAPPPDFLLELPGSAIVAVETMGAVHDPIYVSRKPQTQALMRRIPRIVELFEHEPHAHADDRLRRRLTRLVVRTPT